MIKFERCIHFIRVVPREGKSERNTFCQHHDNKNKEEKKSYYKLGNLYIQTMYRAEIIVKTDFGLVCQR